MLRVIDNGENNAFIKGNNDKFDNVVVQFKGNNGYVQIEDNCRLSDLKIIVGEGYKVTIGTSCILKGRLSAIKGNIFIGSNNEVTGVLKCNAAEDKNIRIGNNCLISSVRIRTSDQHSIINLDTNTRINYGGDVTVGDKVLIFEDVYIGKSVSIGNSSVIATRAVVTKNIPANSIAGGVPAKVIKTGIEWMKELI